MEFDFERRERVMAPLQLVWEEVESLDQILAKTPQALSWDVAPGGQRAQAKIRMAWGPVKWNLDMVAWLEDFRPRQHLLLVIEAPSLEARYEGSIDLEPVGAAETNFIYQAHMECRHRFAARMRGVLAENVEQHVQSVLGRTKVRAEQRRLAQDRLLQ